MENRCVSIPLLFFSFFLNISISVYIVAHICTYNLKKISIISVYIYIHTLMILISFRE